MVINVFLLGFGFRVFSMALWDLGLFWNLDKLNISVTFQPLKLFCNWLVKIANFESIDKHEVLLNENGNKAN